MWSNSPRRCGQTHLVDPSILNSMPVGFKVGTINPDGKNTILKTDLMILMILLTLNSVIENFGQNERLDSRSVDGPWEQKLPNQGQRVKLKRDLKRQYCQYYLFIWLTFCPV